MLLPFRPLTNRERQELFLRRHPDYYRLRRAKRRAEIKARLEAKRLEAQQAAERVTVVRREPLMLPAPAPRIELPDMNPLITIADIEALRAHLARARQAVPATLQPRAASEALHSILRETS